MPTKDQITQAFIEISDLESLEKLYDSYLGKTGSVSMEFKTFKDLDPDTKKLK